MIYNYGGSAIASGSYGCVFKPPLKCKGENRPDEKYVSKLMLNQHANEEIKELIHVKSIINTLPEKNQKYFIGPESKTMLFMRTSLWQILIFL